MKYEDKKWKLASIRTQRNTTRGDFDWASKELETAWAALDFYAQESLYKQGDSWYMKNTVVNDNGKRAREALDE